MTVFPASSRVSQDTFGTPASAPRLAALARNPEFELLCACCAEIPEDQLRQQIRALMCQSLNWQRLAEASEHHGVIPRLYDQLRTVKTEVPAEATTPIRVLYELNFKRTLWLTGELSRILSHFAEHKILAVPYKGPALAESLYGNISARQFSDLDILIHAHDLSRAKQALAELGFTPQLKFTERQERHYLQSGYELTFDSAHARNVLEVQWQILPRFYAVNFDMDSFFRRAVPRTIAGIPLLSLSNEDLLLVLSVHAAKHAWIQLSWLCDVVQLSKQETLDWEFIANQTQQLGVERMVAGTFLLARRLLNHPLPAEVEVNSETERLADQVTPLLEASRHFDTESLQYFKLIARTRERAQDRSRFWWRLATTPSVGEWNAVRLPPALFPFYRVIRPLRAARRFIPFS